MKYTVGAKIISKKPHACGGLEWTVERTGADIKVRCDKCKHALFLSPDKIQKMIKTYIDCGEQNV